MNALPTTLGVTSDKSDKRLVIKEMECEYFDIHKLSRYLSIKKSTLYAKVEAGEIPFYRIGRLIRFRKDEVDQWMANQRREVFDSDSKAKVIFKPVEKQSKNIDRIVKRSVEDVLEKSYTLSQGRPDQTKGQRKEVGNGTL